jgi:thiol:disulfide interchange protein DsbD
MRKLLVIALLLIGSVTFAQQSPVSWAFSSKKISPTVYEVHLTASILPGWHLYSQDQPADAIAIPTSFTFSKNPLLQFDGKVKEVGKLEKFKDEKLEVSAYQYSNKVDFVQKVTLKGKAKTAIAGKLEFQTCDDKKCLPPKTVSFSVPLQ